MPKLTNTMYKASNGSALKKKENKNTCDNGMNAQQNDKVQILTRNEWMITKSVHLEYKTKTMDLDFHGWRVVGISVRVVLRYILARLFIFLLKYCLVVAEIS